jgi:predicted component of type VI protein secretion system
MTYQLIPIEKGRSPAIALQRPVLLIGRHAECDVRIDLPKISRRHCCLALAYDRVLIRDLGSRNGLRVNGRVVEESRLHAGDEIAIGPVIYRLEIEAMTHAPPNTPPARPASTSQKVAEGSPVAASRRTAPVPVSPDSEIDLISLDDLEL